MRLPASIRAMCVALVGVFPSISHADQIVDSTKPGNSGFEITTDPLVDAIHTDKSYRAFKAYKNGKLGTYDFYYQFRIVPQFKQTYKGCIDKVTFGKFLSGLFGVSEASLALLNISIQYRWTVGASVDFAKDTPLVLIGTGPDPQKLTIGNGCYFHVTQSPTFPLLRYGGGGEEQEYDDFVLNFTLIGGKSKSLNAVASISSLFSAFSTANFWSLISGGNLVDAQKAATQFQQALQSAGTFQNHENYGLTLKTAMGKQGRITVSIPKLTAVKGNMIIYVRRYGSIALDTSDTQISPSSIIENLRLLSMTCNPTDIAKGACNPSLGVVKNLQDNLKNIDASLPIYVFDIGNKDKRKKIFDLCQGLRTYTRTALRLSTIDEMLVRWALTKESGLQGILKDPARRKELATDVERPESDLVYACWNDGDEKTLNSIVGALGKTLN